MTSLLSIFFTVNQVTLQLTNVKHNSLGEARGKIYRDDYPNSRYRSKIRRNFEMFTGFRSCPICTLNSRYKILTDDLRKIKTRNKQMLSEQKLLFDAAQLVRNLFGGSLDLFRQSVTDVQLGSLDILPETLRRQVQKTW